MKTVSQMLRNADPLKDETSERVEQARTRMRAAVIAAVPVAPAAAPASISRRGFVVLTATAVVAAVGGVWVGVGNDAAVQAAVRFEVRLAEDRPVPGLIVARAADSARTIYLHPELIVTNDDIAQSWVTQDGPDRFGISIRLLEAGAQRLRQATASHIGRPVAILIDGEVVSAPVVRSAIGDAAMITGDFTEREAQRIVEGIDAR